MVVLTGGIASGKTAVSDRFAALGVPVIDTDRIAHEIVEPGQPALQRIAETFGPEFLDADGHLDRRKMRQAIFADPERKKRLERMLHPIIAEEALRQVHAAQGPYCIVVIPLYTESARWAWIDRILVVDVPEDLQIERVMRRDETTREQARAILAAQSGRQERLPLADDVIENDGTLERLEAEVERLHGKYLALSTGRQ